jgi:hypothetical protein
VCKRTKERPAGGTKAVRRGNPRPAEDNNGRERDGREKEKESEREAEVEGRRAGWYGQVSLARSGSDRCGEPRRLAGSVTVPGIGRDEGLHVCLRMVPYRTVRGHRYIFILSGYLHRMDCIIALILLLCDIHLLSLCTHPAAIGPSQLPLISQASCIFLYLPLLPSAAHSRLSLSDWPLPAH